ncbi:MAG: SDR family oxidoreductase [Planctomycetales bacterium]|nr:SDR family oxidoreductase [Planctomycetales bacterium]
MQGIAGKNVLVTGASSGIGQAIAIRFAQEGAHVVVNYVRNESGADDTLRAIAALGNAVRSEKIQADVARQDEVQRMFEQTISTLGNLDILVNNAGFQVSAPSHELSPESFLAVLNTNLTGSFLCARLAISHWLSVKKPGNIVNISSVHEIIPKPTYLGYSVSKGGLENLTKTLALEYARHGIRVNSVGPGATVTPMNASWIDDAQRRAIVESHIPMGRSGSSEEMASATVFLASDEASYITGQTLFVDGGLTLYPEFGTSWAS